MLPDCTALCMMNKTAKLKQNAQSDIQNYDFKTKINHGLTQINNATQIQVKPKILNKIKAKQTSKAKEKTRAQAKASTPMPVKYIKPVV